MSRFDYGGPLEHGPLYDLLKCRRLTHGDFGHAAAVTSSLKAVLEHETRHLTAGQREALSMIMVKIGRLCAGNPDHADHWDDIAGYALLARGQSHA